MNRSFCSAILSATFAVMAVLCANAPLSMAQGMLNNVDLTSPAYTTAELSRADIEALIADTPDGTALPLGDKNLNGLDLSGLDLSGANLQSSRLMKSKLVGTNLSGAKLDQVWAIEADLSGANLSGASLFGTQLIRATLDRANLSKARVAGDFSMASLKNANFLEADLSADETNQSMGLMRGVFRSANLSGASFRNANLARGMFEFATLDGADLTNANLRGSEFAGARFVGADVTGANFDGVDLNSARIGKLKNKDAAQNFDKAKNLHRAFVND